MPNVRFWKIEIQKHARRIPACERPKHEPKREEAQSHAAGGAGANARLGECAQHFASLLNMQKNQCPNDCNDERKTTWLEFVIDVLKVPEELLDPIADGAAPMRSVRRGHRDCQSTFGSAVEELYPPSIRANFQR